MRPHHGGRPARRHRPSERLPGFPLVFKRFQIWRLLTNFCFLGGFSFPFVMRVMMMCVACATARARSPELARAPPASRPRDSRMSTIRACRPVLRSETLTSSLSPQRSIRCLPRAAHLRRPNRRFRVDDHARHLRPPPLPLIVPSLGLPFLSSSLVFMLLYLWSRENPNANTSIMGFVTLKAFYLPWGMMAATAMMGGSVLPDFLGVIAGHLYYFLTVLQPRAGDPTSSSPRRGSARCVSTPSETRAPGAAVAAPACGDPRTRVRHGKRAPTRQRVARRRTRVSRGGVR